MRRRAIDRVGRLPAFLALAGIFVASGCEAPAERVRLARFDLGEGVKRPPHRTGATETVGVDLPPGSRWPRRVFDVLEHPSRPRDRIFVRCSSPFFAVRTPETLAVPRHWSTRGFYDFGCDPAALDDRRMHRTEDWVAEIRELRAYLALSVIDAGAASEPDSADVERLRALGY